MKHILKITVVAFGLAFTGTAVSANPFGIDPQGDHSSVVQNVGSIGISYPQLP